jgi:hypothetical protein
MMKGYTASLFESLPDTLSRAGVDGLVLDQYQPYVELIPMHLRMPFVHVSNALHVDYTGRTPICFVGWPYKTGVDALARNMEGVRRARILLEPVTAIAHSKYRYSFWRPITGAAGAMGCSIWNKWRREASAGT